MTLALNRLNLTHNQGATLIDLDFANGRYWPALPAVALVDTRASDQWVVDTAGTYSQKTSGVLAYSNSGLLVEPAATNSLLRGNDFNNTLGWAKVNITVTSASLSALGLSFDKIAATTAASTLMNQSVAGIGSASGNTYSIIVGKGSGAVDANRFYFRDVTAATFFQGVQLNLDTGAITYLTGSSGASVVQLATGYWRLSLTGTPAAGNTLMGYVCFAGGVTETAGEYSYVSNAQLEVGTVASSIIPTVATGVTRAANAITIQRTGIGRVVFTFDDNSQQIVSGINPATQYTIPTTLNRRLIKRLTGYAS